MLYRKSSPFCVIRQWEEGLLQSLNLLAFLLK